MNNALIIDIETVGESWAKIDKQTRHVITSSLMSYRTDLDERAAEELAEAELGLSPLTGEIVALGVLDAQTVKGAVYFQAPEAKINDSEIEGLKLKVTSEKDMLEKFWQLAQKYETFVTFSGRIFDLPYIMIRSAIYGI